MNEKDYSSLVPATSIRASTDGTEADNLSHLDTILSKAISADVKEIYLRLLGYTHWMSKPSKQELITTISARGFESKLVEACAVLLSQKPLVLIQDTGNHYIPKDKEICKEAADRIMPEILQMLDQG